MLRRLHKLIAILLSAAIVFAGSGIGGVLAGAIEHELGIESSLVVAPSGESDGSKACDHGCAGHFSGHLLTLASVQQLPATASASAGLVFITDVPAVSTFPDSLFRPPRISLA